MNYAKKLAIPSAYLRILLNKTSFRSHRNQDVVKIFS